MPEDYVRYVKLFLTDAMFELPESEEGQFTVTREYADDKLNKSTMSKLKAVS